MNAWIRVAAGLLPALVAGTASAGMGACVDVRLSSPSAVVRGDVDVHVDVTVTNICRQPVKVLEWQLPSDELSGALFRVTRDGKPVRYTGPVVKRAAAKDTDFVTLQPGVALKYSVELTGAYEFEGNGRYAIEFVSGRGAGGSAAQVLRSTQAQYLWLEGRQDKAQTLSAGLPSAALITPMAASLAYTGNCTASQKTTLSQAVSAATTYTTQSAAYLSATPGATQRYVKWFGAYSLAGWNTAKDHFVKARDAFNGAALTLDCSCKKKGTYAYVYPTQPYKIYVCGAFWTAPMTGTDSKGGTLVHEMMHFNVVAGTDDWAYGQSAAASLALTDPTKALDNSDSHEYFTENSPPLP